MIEKAQTEDLKEIIELQYLAYQSEAKLFGNMDIPPLMQTIEEVCEEFEKGIIPEIQKNLSSDFWEISYNNGKGWLPIGDSSMKFTGSFD